jgi:hypothetical protein
MTEAPPLVTGAVTADGVALSGAEVVLFAPGEDPRFLTSGTTDAAGAFALEPEADGGSALVLARLGTDPVAVLAQEVEMPRPRPVTLDVGPLATVAVTVESDVGHPDELMVSLDPVQPAGVPDPLQPLVTQRGPGVFAGRFATRTVDGRRFDIHVQRGRWRVTAQFIDHDRPNIVAPKFRNYIAAAARAGDGAELPGDESRGFELAVDGDTELTLVLREVADEEL